MSGQYLVDLPSISPASSVSPVKSPLKSPIKTDVDNALNSTYIYNRDIEFINAFFKKKDAGDINEKLPYGRIIKSVIRSAKKRNELTTSTKKRNELTTSTKSMKTKIIINEHLKCKLCKNNTHYTEDCFFKCKRLLCKDLDHKKKECPFWAQ